MLIHIVCWKYRPEVDERVRDDHRLRLRSLATLVPNINRLYVGRDVLHLERSFDTGLVAHFPDRAALDHYTDHPEHLSVVAKGKLIAEKVISVDFLQLD